MRLEIRNCTVNIDAEATREYYRNHPEPYDCGCDICRAYIKHAPDFPEEVREFFASCGIDDMLSVVEVSSYGEDEDPMPIDGWFYAVGSIRGGEPSKVWHPPAYRRRKAFAKRFNKKLYDELCKLERIAELERMSGEYKVCGDFSVRFSNHLALVPESFPENRVQIRFETCIPKLKEE